MDTPPLTPDSTGKASSKASRSRGGSLSSSVSGSDIATPLHSDNPSAPSSPTRTRFVLAPVPERRRVSTHTITSFPPRTRNSGINVHISTHTSRSPSDPDAKQHPFPYEPPAMLSETYNASRRAARTQSLPVSTSAKVALAREFAEKSEVKEVAETESVVHLDAGFGPPRLRESMLSGISSRTLSRSKSSRPASQASAYTARSLFYTSSRVLGRHESDNSLKGKASARSDVFDEHALPTAEQLRKAASLPVLSHDGKCHRFGDLWEGSRTIVIFIRHFRCPACQDYVRSIVTDADVDILDKAGIKIVLIGMGSPSLIRPYAKLLRSRIPLYTDPTLAIHRALGMTLRTTDAGPEHARGDYIAHGVVGGIARMLSSALPGKMSFRHKSGDVTQLGGEFVLGPGLRSTFAHRMTNTRSHCSILRVVSAAGADAYAVRRRSRASSWASMDDEESWMERRRHSLARIREKRLSRRAGACDRPGGYNLPSEDMKPSDMGLSMVRDDLKAHIILEDSTDHKFWGTNF